MTLYFLSHPALPCSDTWIWVAMVNVNAAQPYLYGFLSTPSRHVNNDVSGS